MKYSTDITAGELELGTTFFHIETLSHFEDGNYIRDGFVLTTQEVTDIRYTKAGRVGFCVNGSKAEWSHKPMSPNSFLTKPWKEAEEWRAAQCSM